MLKSLFRILIGVVVVVGLIIAAVMYANYLNTGKFAIPQPPSATGQSASNETEFYVAGAKVEQPWINGYNLHGGYFGSGGQFTLFVNWTYQHKGSVVVPNLSLQRNTGKGWSTVVSSIPFSEAADIQAQVPVYKLPSKVKSQKVSYRFVSTAYKSDLGSVTNTSVSKTTTVTYENPKLYTGFAKKMYQWMAPYCPNTVVHVVVATNKTSTEAGEYVEGQLYIKIDSRIERYSLAADQRTVALHECAHERQFLNWGGTAGGWASMEQAAESIFVNDPTPAGVKPTPGGVGVVEFNPVEHAADCAALSVNPGGYLGYGGYCNKQELAAGKALLQGKRF